MKTNKIIQGNCLEVMKTKPDNSVDSIVTDPPYGLSFMGKKWDYDVPSVEIWKECLRVLKPGGYLLSFAGTRTQHRMCVNIEDAGFEIRDMIAWVYGSGFPKSHNIGKAVDKLQGNEREAVGSRKQNGTKFKLHEDPEYTRTYQQGFNNPNRTEFEITKGSSDWEGWGTALKPALEPITVARKPFKGTVANNVLKWGTGGINIDGCRVGYQSEEEKKSLYRSPKDYSPFDTKKGWNNNNLKYNYKVSEQGRFPANLIHDGSDEVVGLFPETKSGSKPGQKGKSLIGSENGETRQRIENAYGDSGSAARFFYCAKASKSERNEGCEGLEEKQYSHDGRNKEIENAYQRNKSVSTNNHPTVKPTKLMQYLVRLVTPKGGTVLDPFMGSGSTGIACKREGFDFIGIELDEDYCNIAKARIEKFKFQHELF